MYIINFIIGGVAAFLLRISVPEAGGVFCKGRKSKTEKNRLNGYASALLQFCCSLISSPWEPDEAGTVLEFLFQPPPLGSTPLLFFCFPVFLQWIFLSCCLFCFLITFCSSFCFFFLRMFLTSKFHPCFPLLSSLLSYICYSRPIKGMRTTSVRLCFPFFVTCPH